MRTAMVVLAAIVAGLVPVGSPSTSGAPMPIFVELDKPVVGARGPVAIVGDSVMLGSAYEIGGWGPSVAQMMVERGWGPVRMKAGVGFGTGRLHAGNPGADMGRWLQLQRAGGFDPPVVMVSLGPNEILGCSGSMACAAASIRYFLDIAGPTTQVWWTLITMTNPAHQQAWNGALEIVAAERPNLMLWDWPTVQAMTAIPLAADRIHLPSATAYRSRSVLMADDVTTRLGLSRPVASTVSLPSGGEPSTYVPVGPRRVVDTREHGTRPGVGGELVVDLGALAPDLVGVDAVAVAVNVAAADPELAGYLTLYPCDAPRPVASSVNHPAGRSRSAQAVSQLGVGRKLCIFSSAGSDVVVDLQGVFVPARGTRLSPVPPVRVLDTRLVGRAATSTIVAPQGAEAVALTISVVADANPGFLAAYPCGDTVPLVANLNWVAGEVISGAAFVPVSPEGTFCVTTNTPVDVVVDLTGTFADDGALRFVSVPAVRSLDTRTGTGGWFGPQGVGQVLSVPVAPADAVAVTGTLALVGPATESYLTGAPCGSAPGATASVSAARGAVMANNLTVGLSPGGALCISSIAATHTVFDTTGWWVP